MISVLCVDLDTNYRSIRGLDLWNKERNAYLFDGQNPVITHAPCQQWSRMRAFSHNNPFEKELAWFCLEKVRNNGGIFEHPHGSVFFKEAGIKPTVTIDQSWFGFPARKRTWLYFVGCRPLSCQVGIDLQLTKVEAMSRSKRSRMPLPFCRWLVDCVKAGL